MSRDAMEFVILPAIMLIRLGPIETIDTDFSGTVFIDFSDFARQQFLSTMILDNCISPQTLPQFAFSYGLYCFQYIK